MTVQLWLRHKPKWNQAVAFFTPTAGKPLTVDQWNSLQSTCGMHVFMCPHVCLIFIPELFVCSVSLHALTFLRTLHFSLADRNCLSQPVFYFFFSEKSWVSKTGD